MRLSSLICIAFISLFAALPAQAQVVATYALSDCSVSSLTGSSQSLVAANPQRKYLLIVNSGANNAYVNLAGGTAATSGISSAQISPQGTVLLSGATVARNAVTVIGTSAQPVTCYEGR